MKTAVPVPVWHDLVWHDRIVRHIKAPGGIPKSGTVRIGMKVWNVIPVPEDHAWIVVNESSHSYRSGGRNARLLGKRSK